MDVKRLYRDPRCYQIAALATLVGFGATVVGIGIDAVDALLIALTCLGVQRAGTALAGLPHFEPLSALITALSLTMLFRADAAWLAAGAAAVAVGSKFLLRVRGKHLFNPANIGIVVMVLVSDRAWVSTGQWGATALSALALACMGMVVVTRARRIETTAAFLATFGLLLAGRAAWLGDPAAIVLHQLSNGALLIFAFFMISDPKTTPDTAAGRWLYGGIVAVVAFAIRFVLHEPAAAIFALAAAAPLVPVIDAALRGDAYRWVEPAQENPPTKGVEPCESSLPLSPPA